MNLYSWEGGLSLLRSPNPPSSVRKKATPQKQDSPQPDSILKIYNIYKRCAPSANSFIFSSREGFLICVQKSLDNGIQKFPMISNYVILTDSALEDASQFSSPSQFRLLCLDSIKSCQNPYDPNIYWKQSISNRKCEILLNNKIYKHFGYEGLISFFDSHKDEAVGYKKYLWEYDAWSFLEYEYNTRKRPILISAVPRSQLICKSPLDIKRKVREGEVLEIDRFLYQKISLLKDKSSPCSSSLVSDSIIQAALNESSQPTLKEKNHKNSFYNLPILCIDIQTYEKRTDKSDWVIQTLLNRFNGNFFQILSFSDENHSIKPYIRDLAMDYCAGVHLCRKSTVGIPLRKYEKTIKFNSRKKLSYKNVHLSYDGSKIWEPLPAPYDKNEIPKHRLLLLNEKNICFGSTSPIWELGIWERLGMMFKLNPKAEIYLCGYGTLLQAAETKTVKEEHALIKKCGVLMTAELYSELEKLRKSQK